MKTILIAKKCLERETELAFVFRVSYYDNKYFSIPKSQITNQDEGEIEVNPSYKEKCFKFTLTNFIYQKLEYEFKRLGEFKYKELI